MSFTRTLRAWLATLSTVWVPLLITLTGWTGFWPVLGVCAAAVIWSAWLFRQDIRRLTLIPPDAHSQNYEKAWWLLFPGIAMLAIALFPFVNLYVSIKHQPEQLGFEDVLQTYMHDRVIYITDLVRTEPIIHDKIFDRVTFVGPAMATFLVDVDMTDCGIVGNEKPVFLVVPPNTYSVAAIGVKHCIFRHCHFERIQFVGLQQMIGQIKASMRPPPVEGSD